MAVQKRKPATPVPPRAQVTTLCLDELTADPSNVRKHDGRNRQVISSSLNRFGAGRSLVVDGKNQIVAGNGTFDEASRNGFTEVIVVEPRPGQLVAVRRPEWSESEAKAYAIVDNRSTDLSSFLDADLADALRALEADAFDLDELGFGAADLNELEARGALGSEPAPEIAAARVPTAPASATDKPEYKCAHCGAAWNHPIAPDLIKIEA